MRMILRVSVSVFVSVALSPVLSLAEELRSQVFPLPNRGKIHMTVPANWRSKVVQPPGKLPPTIAFSPETGSGFEVMMTAVWPLGAGAKPPTREQVRKHAEQAAVAAKPLSVEQQVTLKELRGPSAAG